MSGYVTIMESDVKEFRDSLCAILTEYEEDKGDRYEYVNYFYNFLVDIHNAIDDLSYN